MRMLCRLGYHRWYDVKLVWIKHVILTIPARRCQRCDCFHDDNMEAIQMACALLRQFPVAIPSLL